MCLIQDTIFRDVTQCSLVEVYQFSSTLKIKAVCTSEMSTNVYPVTQESILEGSALHNHRPKIQLCFMLLLK